MNPRVIKNDKNLARLAIENCIIENNEDIKFLTSIVLDKNSEKDGENTEELLATIHMKYSLVALLEEKIEELK